MTKEELIKRAWEHYGVVSGWDADGWVMKYLLSDEKIFNMDWQGSVHNSIHRPKELRGIQHNNGWVSIHAEKDLPTPNDIHDCYVYTEDGNIELACTELLEHEDVKEYWLNNITHYQLITKPLPPLYD